MNNIDKDINNLADLLEVSKPDKTSQDWEYELNIEPARVYNFLDIYEKVDLSDYQKELLLKIIIEMINDSMEIDNEYLNLLLILPRIKRILKQDFNIHENTIYRYANLENDLSDSLLVTPFFREFLESL